MGYLAYVKDLLLVVNRGRAKMGAGYKRLNIIASYYSRKLRFSFHPSKCSVVVVGGGVERIL